MRQGMHPYQRHTNKRRTETQSTLYHFRAAVSLGGHLVDAAPPHRDQRELRGDKEGIEQDQQQHDEQSPRSGTEGDLVDDGQRRVSKHTERKRTRG